MNSKYLIVGDLQARKENRDLYMRLFDLVDTTCKVKNINKVIWLGDMLDRRGFIEAECLNDLCKYFSESSLDHVVIVGNHDLITMKSDKTALEPLSRLENVALIDSPLVIGDMGFLPYYRDSSVFLNHVSNMNSKYLFCHQGVKEFTIGSGYSEEEAVNISDLKKFQLVVAGHYHTPNEMKNVVFLGSPFSHSFSESNEKKRLGVFDSASGALEYIEIREFPVHITKTIDLSAGDSLKDSLDHVQEMASLGRIIARAVISGTEQQLASVNKKDWPNVKIIEKIVGFESSSAIIQEVDDNINKFLKWAEEIKKLDNKTIELGRGILEDVQ